MASSPQTLDGLLAETDAVSAVNLPVDAATFSSRVRTIARGRRRIRHVAASGTAILAALVLGLLAWNQFTPPPHPVVQTPMPASPTPAQLAAVRAELLALDEESRRREALVERLLEGERRRLAAAGLRRASASPDALQRLGYEQDRAALVLIHQADRFSRHAKYKDSAAQGYRRVVELFPRSQWAAVARQRLDELPG